MMKTENRPEPTVDACIELLRDLATEPQFGPCELRLIWELLLWMRQRPEPMNPMVFSEFAAEISGGLEGRLETALIGAGYLVAYRLKAKRARRCTVLRARRCEHLRAQSTCALPSSEACPKWEGCLA
jgi:hypothetical protein